MISLIKEPHVDLLRLEWLLKLCVIVSFT